MKSVGGQTPVPLLPIMEPELARVLESAETAPLAVIVVLRASQAGPAVPEAGPGWSPLAVRTALVSRWQRELVQAAAPVEPLLREGERRGELLARRDLWIIRGIALTARPALVRRLAQSPAVSSVTYDHQQNYLPPQPTFLPAPAGAETAREHPKAADSPASEADEWPAWGVAKIRAPEVWATLGISGTGAVVAGMDTGTDWQHPLLQGSYRGNLGRGLVNHRGSWFDAVNGGSYPYDDHGHGTHTLGSAVGADGAGVAPGARWISVKVLASSGSALDSWIHAGFQWLLAPEGDPALAPDVVNCSWGNSDSTITIYQEDIDRLLAAGILPVFAAGNEGPGSETLRSPASLPGVFAVGSSDPDDDIAPSSSRGPSPWGEIKPHIVAPGVLIRSAYPGGTIQTMSGTSMAAPHVAGIATLMRAVSPTVAPLTMVRLITETAVPLTTTLPNNESGWGRVDAFEALVALARPGLISGTVRNVSGNRVPEARIVAAPRTESGNPVVVTADAQGRYRLALAPGIYDLTASAFGHLPQAQGGVPVLTGTFRTVDFNLEALPQGTVVGQAIVLETGEVPTRPVTVRVLDTPVTTTLDTMGRYVLGLPAGVYTLEARGVGYRVITGTVRVNTGETRELNFDLRASPTLLLVDEGAWYYGSRIDLWRSALNALGYAYDDWRIKNLSTDIPLSTTLKAYDTVLWSSPNGSPGMSQSARALEEYLLLGGHLFLSGQDVAYYDGGSFFFPLEPYFTLLGARFESDSALSRTVNGVGAMDGLTVTIAGGDGANNQTSPDEIRVVAQGPGQPLWQYQGGGYGGVSASICTPYRALYASYGFEAINTAADRQTVLAHALDWLATSPLTRGLQLQESTAIRIAQPGRVISHTLLLRNIGQGGPADSITITAGGNHWPVQVQPMQAIVSPCAVLTVTVAVTIPMDTGSNVSDVVTVNLRSGRVPEGVTATLYTKTPSPLLLVDDDRWYPMESRYRAALDALGFPYDRWDTRHMEIGDSRLTSPPTDTLQTYPLVLWFTGYDWYEPIAAHEEPRLLAYLAGGGRLLLSSQDFLYYHDQGALAREFGVLRWSENLTPTTAAGISEHPASGSWGPVTLQFPFRNWGDLIEPTSDAQPVLRGQAGQPLAIAADQGASRSLFYGFPLESLPPEDLAEALERGLGWLSPLGRSRWEFSAWAPQPGERVTATLVLVNDETRTSGRLVRMSHVLPPALTVDPATLPFGMAYDFNSAGLSWTGTVTPGHPLTLTWGMTVMPEAPVGSVLTPTVTLTFLDWGFSFRRAAGLRIAGADLDGQWVGAVAGTLSGIGSPATPTFRLRNFGPGVAQGTLQVWMMGGITPLTATIPSTIGLGLPLWTGSLAAGESVTLTVPVSLAALIPYRIDALWEGEVAEERREWRLWLDPDPWRLYLPLVLRGESQ